MAVLPITLVATPGAIRANFPDLAATPRGGVVTMEFYIEPADCQTKLGRWLAENVASTDGLDPRSEVRLLFPETVEGSHMAAMGKRLQEAAEADVLGALQLLAEVAEWVEQRRCAIRDESTSFNYRIERFRWPVFGGKSTKTTYTQTYFDVCARYLRDTGAVILSVGRERKRLPHDLSHTMANGHGHFILNRYFERFDDDLAPPAPEQRKDPSFA